MSTNTSYITTSRDKMVMFFLLKWMKINTYVPNLFLVHYYLHVFKYGPFSHIAWQKIAFLLHPDNSAYLCLRMIDKVFCRLFFSSISYQYVNRTGCSIMSYPKTVIPHCSSLLRELFLNIFLWYQMRRRTSRAPDGKRQVCPERL